MSQRANPAAIGLFVIGAVLLAATSIVFFGSTHWFSHTQRFIIFFEESVNGLDIGAPVKFKGVPIGEVSSILLNFDKSGKTAEVPVVVCIDESRLYESMGFPSGEDFKEALNVAIENGLRARLQYQSFVTGLLFIDLNYHPDAEPVTAHYTNFTNYPLIPAISSGVGEIWKSVSTTLGHLNQIDFVAISRNLQQVLQHFNDDLTHLNLKELSASFNRTLAHMDAIFANPDINHGLHSFSRAMYKIDQGIDPLMNDIHKTLATARVSFNAVQESFEPLESMFDPDSLFRQDFDNALESFDQASRAIKRLADSIERNPSSLILGK